jgi:glycosyltransferase involved in cell wall biosynthesis
MPSSIWLASVGDVTDPGTFSGTPYHCLQAGLAQGVFAGGLKLESTGRHWQCRRALWNAGQLLTSGHYGGYQYSQSFLDRLWLNANFCQEDVGVLNFFQLYPETMMRRPKTRRWFYIDQTLDQLFSYYGIANIVPEVVRKDALARERDQYEASEAVICHSRWAATSVINRYGISPNKVYTVHYGANLDPDAVQAWEQRIADGRTSWSRREHSLKVVFVGKEWQRKGLDRLIRAMKIARGRKVSLELIVLGVIPDKLPHDLASVPGIYWGGFINKRTSAARFISIIAECDVGCLLSHAEAGGMSLLEFARLGLPAIAPDTGGNPELVAAEASHLVAPNAPDEVIADILTSLATDEDLLARQRQAAMAMRHKAGWEYSISMLAPILNATEPQDEAHKFDLSKP